MRRGLPHWGQPSPAQRHLQIGELALEIGSGRHRREVVPVAVGPDHVAATAERLVGQDARHPARADRSHRAGRDAQVSRDLLGARGARLPLERAGELALVQGMVASHQREEGRVVCDEHERLDGEGGIDPEECRHLRDGTDVGGRHLAALPVGSGGCRGHGAGQLDIGRISAPVAQGDVVLPGRARGHELVRAGAPHHAGIRLHDDILEAAPIEDPAVGVLVGIVGHLERRDIGVERVGILHQELSRPKDAGARAGLVPFLGLDLVPDLWQVAVRADLLGGEPRHDLFVGHPETHVAVVAVLQLEHLGDAVPAARLLPDLGGMEHRHRDLLSADSVHLLADDRVDLVQHALAHRQIDVDAGGELAHEAGSHHQLVADRLGVGGDLPQRGDE